MGRLTEAFGFANVKPEHFTGLWKAHHIVALDPYAEGLLKFRKETLKQKRVEAKEEKLKNID